jgi:hypothetical protein
MRRWEYPLFYRVWHKPETTGEGLTKLDLAKQMLLMLRESVACRFWIAMDRWYLCKEFFVFLEDHQFDWVTKAKRNTALFRKVIEPCTRRERYVPLTPVMLIREVFKDLVRQAKSGIVSVAIPGILHETAVYGNKPKRKTGHEAAICFKRWRIEVFFRAAKQELALEKCHSESEAHHHAHFELLFVAETLLLLHDMN